MPQTSDASYEFIVVQCHEYAINYRDTPILSPACTRHDCALHVSTPDHFP